MLHLPNCKCIFYNVIKKTHFFFFKSEFTLIQYTMAVYRYDRSTASLDGAGAAALTRIVSRQETGAGMIVGLRLETRSGFTSGNQIRLTDVFICGTGAVPYLYFEVRFCHFGEVNPHQTRSGSGFGLGAVSLLGYQSYMEFLKIPTYWCQNLCKLLWKGHF